MSKVDEEKLAMAERIGGLIHELEELKSKSWEWRRRLYWDKWWTSLTFFVVVVFLLCLGGYPLFKFITTSPVPTHCTIQRGHLGLYTLKGSVPWRTDVTYGRFCSIESAQEAAEDLNCTVRGSQ
jgi:hypothetical protein